MLFTAAGALSPGAFVSFALRFPDVIPRGPGRFLERAALFVLTPFLLAFGLIHTFAYILPFLSVTFAWTRGIWPTSPTTTDLSQACAVFAPIALAYTVLKHRLFDIRLVLIRGAMMATLHRRVENMLNHVIFRSQTLALAGLRRFAQETDLIADPQRLLSQTNDALSSRLEADYVALYTADGAFYTLSTSRATALPTTLAADDFAVLRVRRWEEPFECDEASHPLRGALFVPMTARTRLVGFIVCGPKRDGTHYLPEEVDALTMLSHRVASSYLWLTIVSNAPLFSSPSFESPA